MEQPTGNNSNNNINSTTTTRPILSTGSTTQTQTTITTQTTETQIVGTLHLSSEAPRVQWSDDTIDNEFMGKKKSKSQC